MYDSSTANLSEVYLQVKNNFDVIADEQWKMLNIAGDYLVLSGSDTADIVKRVEKWNRDWQFTQFYFLDADGNYCTPDGTGGIVDLGSSWRKLFRKGQNIVVDGSIPGKDAMMFFAVPTEEGNYQGFTYTAIAIAYDMATLNKELGVTAFDGKSSCYIIAPNGRIILSNDTADDMGSNLLFHLKGSSLSTEEQDALRAQFEQGVSGSLKYTCYTDNNRSNYLFYVPVGIEDWTLVAMVPTDMVDESSRSIQESITIMQLVIFGICMIVIILVLLWANRRKINEKNRKIWQQETLFKQMANHMNNIFVLYNIKTSRVEFISANTQRVLGIDRQTAETGISGIAAAFQDPEHFSGLCDAIMQLEPGKSTAITEKMINRLTGEEYVYQVSAIREKEGKDLVSIIFSDRTKEEESKKQIGDALMVAEHANKAKTIFLNNMSHDIRTPMNAIIGFTSLVINHIDDKAAIRDYLKKISISSEHLLSLINDVLDMSRIESGTVKIDETECSLPNIVHDLRNLLQANIKAKRQEFFIDTMDVEHEEIICDKLRLNQVLINITGNAIKYTPAGGTIGIRVTEIPNAPEGYADYEFSVKDNGIGMSEDYVRHIFEPFTREQNSTVSGIQGTGLGMAITKNIVDMMEGNIRVNSKLGEGSEFIVSLRFRISGHQKKVTVIPKLKGFRALVADDSMDSCCSVSKMLKVVGMRPEWTTSGKEAVFRAQLATQERDPFKVYIIDWLMPDMNGVEVVRRIRREIGDQIPIIILTAYDWTDVESEARAAGVTAFCSKPLFLTELYEVLSDTREEVQEETIASDAFRGKHVLLVDDVELNREIAAAVLEEAGIKVSMASNGQEAINFMNASKPGDIDLILMDIMMPVMDGFEATQVLRRSEDPYIANIPIIAMTANAFEEDRKAAIEAGMNDHLAKPFQIEKLFEMMNKYI